MTKLVDLARVVRSKNAGALQLTIDLMFENMESFVRVRDSSALTPRSLAPRFGLSDNQVAIFYCDEALAIKITVPRSTRSGDAADSDVYGAQQYAPLLAIDIPD
tara:strand:+ start:100 stop:411 length:312 start_codon:yes stop_codon:yes gene_type:complete